MEFCAKGAEVTDSVLVWIVRFLLHSGYGLDSTCPPVILKWMTKLYRVDALTYSSGSSSVKVPWLLLQAKNWWFQCSLLYHQRKILEIRASWYTVGHSSHMYEGQCVLFTGNQWKLHLLHGTLRNQIMEDHSNSFPQWEDGENRIPGGLQ